MGLSSRGLLLRGAFALLLATGGSGSSSSHSLSYFYTAVSEPSPGLPRFSIVGYLDGQPFIKYDSIKRRYVPRVPWMEEVGKEDPKYWEKNTQRSRAAESAFRADLEIMQDHYSQKTRTGFHTLQATYGCEVRLDGQPSRVYRQDAYDGEELLSLDVKTATWKAHKSQTLVTKRGWENETQWAQYWKSNLEKECVKGLQSLLEYGKETLQRTERPTARMARKKGYDGQETLFCQLYGFYPKEIEVTWMKDGEDQMAETWTGGVVPNSDGTYHTWLSIEVDPKEKGSYRCRVGHDSLSEPQDLAWEEPASNLGLILGIVGALLAALLLVGAGVAVYMRKRRPMGGYEAVSRSDQGSDTSTRVSVPEA